MTPAGNKGIDRRKKLYTYWHELPFRKMVSAESYFRLQQSDVKHFILKYIRDGLKDEFGETHGLRRRHAFTVKELQAAYENQPTGQHYSISNFHFHINNLVEEGYIREITKILQNRHHISYYGRTAKSFDPMLDEYMSDYIETNIIQPLKLIISELNPEIEEETIEKVFEESEKQMEVFYSAVGTWTEEMYPQIYRSKLDLAAFERYIPHFALMYGPLSSSLRKIARLTKLDQYIATNGTNGDEKKQ